MPPFRITRPFPSHRSRSASVRNRRSIMIHGVPQSFRRKGAVLSCCGGRRLAHFARNDRMGRFEWAPIMHQERTWLQGGCTGWEGQFGPARTLRVRRAAGFGAFSSRCRVRLLPYPREQPFSVLCEIEIALGSEEHPFLDPDSQMDCRHKSKKKNTGRHRVEKVKAYPRIGDDHSGVGGVPDEAIGAGIHYCVPGCCANQVRIELSQRSDRPQSATTAGHEETHAEEMYNARRLPCGRKPQCGEERQGLGGTIDQARCGVRRFFSFGVGIPSRNRCLHQQPQDVQADEHVIRIDRVAKSSGSNLHFSQISVASGSPIFFTSLHEREALNEARKSPVPGVFPLEPPCSDGSQRTI